MSVLQIRHNEAKLFGSEKYIDEEYTVASREVSRLPTNFVQYWVDTGHLPYHFCKDTAVHSDTGSSLSEEGSYKHSAICNTMLKHKLKDKQLCNSGSSNSSVDTVAYVLSNTNVKKRKNTYPRFFKKDRILKIHKDINYKDNRTGTAVNIYDTAISTISNKRYAFDMYSSNETYRKDKELEEESVIEEIELKLPASSKADNDEIRGNDKQVNEDHVDCQDKEFIKNSIQITENITNANRNNSLHEVSQSDSVKPLRQKKLYVGRESPIDITMPIITESADSNMDEEKRNLHPAYRNSPLLQKPYRKFMSKKRKYNFFLKNSKNKSKEDTSSNNSTSDSIDVDTRHAKRQKSLNDPESYIDEIQLFSTTSQTSGKDKLRQSCKEMEKQIQRFEALELTHINELKQLNHDIISQSSIKHKEKNPRYGRRTRSKTKIQGTVMQEETNVRTMSCNTLNEKHNPIVLLERLSEKLINHYVNRKDLKSKVTRKNSVPIKNITEHKNKRNYYTRSFKSKDTDLHWQLENVTVNSGESNASTMIINNHVNSRSSNLYDSNDAANSHNTGKNKLEKLLSDIKLIQMQAVVVLERLHTTESSKKKHLSKLNNMKIKLQPIVVLERLVNIDRNSSCNINSLACNEFNETNVSAKENRKTNKMMDHNYEHNKKLIYFETNMNSDSDSDVSSIKCAFNLNGYMKYNTQNKMMNQTSFNSLKINMPEDFKCMGDKKTSISNICTVKPELDKKHTSIHDSISHMLTDDKDNCFGKLSCTDNKLHNFNRSDNNQKVCASPNIQLIGNDTSEKDKVILENIVRNTVIIDTNMKNKQNKFVFVTKVYDSDSD